VVANTDPFTDMSHDKWRGKAFDIGDLYVNRHRIVSKDFFPEFAIPLGLSVPGKWDR